MWSLPWNDCKTSEEQLDHLSKLFQAKDAPQSQMNAGRTKKKMTASRNDTATTKTQFSQEERDHFVEKNLEDLQLFECFYNQSLLLHV